MRPCPNNKWSHGMGLAACNCVAQAQANFPSVGGPGNASHQDDAPMHEQIGLTQGPHNPRGGYYVQAITDAPLRAPSLAVEDLDARRQNRMPVAYQVPGVEPQWGTGLRTLGDWYLNECVHAPAMNPRLPEIYLRHPATPQGKPFSSVSIKVPNS